jgi:hypothetical protein
MVGNFSIYSISSIKLACWALTRRRSFHSPFGFAIAILTYFSCGILVSVVFGYVFWQGPIAAIYPILLNATPHIPRYFALTTEPA